MVAAILDFNFIIVYSILLLLIDFIIRHTQVKLKTHRHFYFRGFGTSPNLHLKTLQSRRGYVTQIKHKSIFTYNRGYHFKYIFIIHHHGKLIYLMRGNLINKNANKYYINLFIFNQRVLYYFYNT